MVKELTRVVKNAKTGRECEKIAKRVGKKLDETPHRKVDEEVAAATGLGKMTMKHHRPDGVSPMTPASSP